MAKKEQNYLTAYIFNRNKTISTFIVTATKKFVINDETYIIKDSCTYKKIINNEIKLIAFYSESNPNPYNIKTIEKNFGLTDKELDDIIAGDMYNILLECQNISKQGYILGISIFCLVLNIFNCFILFFW